MKTGESALFEACFSSVPVIEAHRDNWEQILPYLTLAIRNSHFVAIDCELSGLGDRKRLNCPYIDERYENMCKVAQTRSIIAIGISTLERAEPESNQRFIMKTFNVVVLCNEDYIVEPSALQFLIEHGFDFQKQYSRGVLYNRGSSQEPSQVRDLFSELIRSKKPLIVHNGFVDLVFLYQSLYAQLPAKLDAFLADLTQMFPQGIYDTKYIADYILQAPASYLEYLFRWKQRVNEQKCAKCLSHVKVSFPSSHELSLREHVEHRYCAVAYDTGDLSQLCDAYANHGYCADGSKCKKSHNVDLAIQKMESKKRKKSDEPEQGKRAKLTTANGNAAKERQSGGHRAGFDAFMTGFLFACHLASQNGHENDLLEAIVNNVYLVGKDRPLLIRKSAFTSYSAAHRSQYERIFQQEK